MLESSLVNPNRQWFISICFDLFLCAPPPVLCPPLSLSLGSQQSVASLSSAPVSVTGVGAGAGYKYSHLSIHPVSRDQHQGAINIGSEPFSQISKPIISTQHFRNFERVISFGFPMQCNVISKKFCFVIFSKVSYNVIQEIVEETTGSKVYFR